MLQVIADTGSFAAAARQLQLVPSALTYRVRQMEEALARPSPPRPDRPCWPKVHVCCRTLMPLPTAYAV